MIFTPQTLAYILDIEEYQVRIWLRHFYPKSAPGKGGRWVITQRMARHIARLARAETVAQVQASRAA